MSKMGKNIETVTVQIIRTRSDYTVYRRTGILISFRSRDQILVSARQPKIGPLVRLLTDTDYGIVYVLDINAASNVALV